MVSVLIKWWALPLLYSLRLCCTTDNGFGPHSGHGRLSKGNVEYDVKTSVNHKRSCSVGRFGDPTTYLYTGISTFIL